MISINSFNMYEDVCSSQHYIHGSTSSSSSPFNANIEHNGGILIPNSTSSFDDLRPLDPMSLRRKTATTTDETPTGSNRSRKRSRRPRVSKNKEEAETQRMTHITVERNRRKQMNEYLAVLRSLMPESYTHRLLVIERSSCRLMHFDTIRTPRSISQAENGRWPQPNLFKGDQASIVGGAIEYVKELEQLLQSLEARKRILNQKEDSGDNNNNQRGVTNNFFPPPFSQFFTCPQFSWCQVPGENPSESRTSIADIEVTLIESHANLKILTRRRHRQLFKLVAGFQTLQLTILHLNVTTLDPLVFYSLSAKVEEGCHLNSVDDIANAVHHMVRIIEEEADPALV